MCGSLFVVQLYFRNKQTDADERIWENNSQSAEPELP